MSAEAKNLERICAAIVHHNTTCTFPASGVALNPHEAERLGWDEIKGVPVVPDPHIGTGAFRIICERQDMTQGRALEDALPTAPERAPVVAIAGEDIPAGSAVVIDLDSGTMVRAPSVGRNG